MHMYSSYHALILSIYLNNCYKALLSIISKLLECYDGNKVSILLK